MSEEYRHHFFVKRPSPASGREEQKPLRVLSAGEQAKVAANRAAVHEHLPEVVPFIKELHEAGMIDGWRGVGEVVVHASTCSARTDSIGGKEHGTA